jgi:hypothetical protein
MAVGAPTHDDHAPHGPFGLAVRDRPSFGRHDTDVAAVPREDELAGESEGFDVRLAVGQSSINGRGVFAQHDIRAGEFIHRMGGRRISLARCIAEIALGAIRIDDPLSIGKYQLLVLDEFSILFNHCCEANAALVNAADLVAQQDIGRGQEITFDYSMTVRRSFYTPFWKMSCNCGAAACRGRIGDVRSVPAPHLQKYVEAGALQNFILDSLNCRVPSRSAAARRATAAARSSPL